MRVVCRDDLVNLDIAVHNLIKQTLGGRYHVEAVISQGGTRAVYRAIDTRLERPVAVKAMKYSTGWTRNAIRDEAALSSRLPQHPNVLCVHDYGTDNNLEVDFLVMKLLHGVNLSEWKSKQRAPLPIADALYFLRQAAFGLAVVHRAGLVHCAVRPNHLFLSNASDPEDRSVVLIGFERAQHQQTDEEHPIRINMLNSRYAAPEQLLGGTGVTPAVDIFSLALTILEMLIGEYPVWLTSADIQETPDLTLNRHVGRCPNLPRWFAEVLRRALSIRVESRFADAMEFLDALQMRDATVHQREPAEAGGSEKIATRDLRIESDLAAVRHDLSRIAASLSASQDILEIKPNIGGIGINVRAFVRRFFPRGGDIE